MSRRKQDECCWQKIIKISGFNLNLTIIRLEDDTYSFTIICKPLAISWVLMIEVRITVNGDSFC